MPGWLMDICYGFILAACTPWLLYRYYWQRKNFGPWRERFLGDIRIGHRGSKTIWIHAVSVGEVLLLRPVIARLLKQYPQATILLTTTTDSGAKVAQTTFPNCVQARFPLDFSWAVRRALQQVQPDLIVLAELELWPNLLREATRQKIPVILINARLGDRSFRGYRRLSILFRPLLQRLTGVASQSEECSRRFAILGVPAERIQTTGSIKFDGLQSDRAHPRTRDLREHFKLLPGEQVLIAGSTQAPEERYALDTYVLLHERFRHLRLIIVPRHPERSEAVAEMIMQRGLAVQRRSQPRPQFPAGAGGAALPEFGPVVGLLDTVGELGTCWGLADIAFVGGSFTNRGGQNMMEPAAYGAAVCFGPNTWNFRHVVDQLRRDDAVQVVYNQHELTGFVERMLSNPVAASQMGHKARTLVLSQQGATERTMGLIAAVLDATVSGDQFHAVDFHQRAA